MGAELAERLAAARAAGCHETWVDPGIGFGKRLEHNLALLTALPALRARLDVPLMVGVSRKAFIGQLTGKPAARTDLRDGGGGHRRRAGRRGGRARPRRRPRCATSSRWSPKRLSGTSINDARKPWPDENSRKLFGTDGIRGVANATR